ncbi:MAG: hypothetical protein IJ327_07665 [Lachnospiraceae bacterium]|nr:hypothetical protein [Lachnospiraceae bacterium]
MLIGFIVWALVGAAIIALGIYDYHAPSTRPFGFWSNVKVFEVTDVRAYNRALGKLFMVYGSVFILLGLPMLAGQNNAWLVLTLVGVAFASIAAMAVYVTVIEPKYRKN